MRDPSLETSLPPPAGRAVPLRPEDVTADWLTACLRHAGVLGEGRVIGLRHARVGQGKGFAGHLARVEIDYDDPRPESPPSLIAKFASPHASTDAMMHEVGAYEREVRFYRELADDVGVSIPRCYFAHYDRAQTQFLLLIEDLSPAASPGTERGLSPEQAATVMEQLAAMHAHWWGRSDECAWLQFDDDMARRVRDEFIAALPEFDARWGAKMPTLAAVAAMMVEVFQGDEWLDSVRRGPLTLVHNDMHVENIFLPTEQGGRFALIDWQVPGFARHGMGDVTRVLSACMPAELRRAHQDRLLAHYHTQLLQRGVRGYSLRHLRLRYRQEVVSMATVGVLAFARIDFAAEDGLQVAEIVGERIERALQDARARPGLGAVVWWLRISRGVRRLLGLARPPRLPPPSG